MDCASRSYHPGTQSAPKRDKPDERPILESRPANQSAAVTVSQGEPRLTLPLVVSLFVLLSLSLIDPELGWAQGPPEARDRNPTQPVLGWTTDQPWLPHHVQGKLDPALLKQVLEDELDIPHRFIVELEAQVDLRACPKTSSHIDN
jgi:hypothetical protein